MMLPGLFPALAALQFLPGNLPLSFFVQVVLIFGIFYFLVIRPQQAQKRKHEESLRGIKRGDQIVTFGGIIGEVVHVKESVGADGTALSSMEDQITIRSAESRLIVERGRIARVGGSPSPSLPPKSSP